MTAEETPEDRLNKVVLPACAELLRAYGYTVLPPLGDEQSVAEALRVLREVRTIANRAIDRLVTLGAVAEDPPVEPRPHYDFSEARKLSNLPEFAVDLYRVRNVEVGVGARCPECRGGAFHKMDCSRRGDPLPPDPEAAQ